MFVRENCNLCLSFNTSVVRTYLVRHEQADIHWRRYLTLTGKDEIPIDILMCNECGQICQKQLVDDDELSKLDTVRGEWNREVPIEFTYWKTNITMNVQRFHDVISYILHYSGDLSGKRVLDIGGRDGGFGAPLMKYGIDMTAIDVDDWTGRGIPGAKIIHGDFDTYQFGHKFDLLVLNHCLEHTFYPIKTLERCYEVLDEDGLVFIDVPLLPMWPGTWHRSEPYIAPLFSDAVRRAGFDIIDADSRLIGYDNSVIGDYRIIARKAKKKAKKKNIQPRNFREYALNLVTDFHHDIVNYFVQSQEPLLVYGANAYAQRLLGPTRLPQTNFLGFVDDNPDLHGKPFFGKPVLSPEQIVESGAKAIIIMTYDKNGKREELLPISEKGVHLISIPPSAGYLVISNSGGMLPEMKVEAPSEQETALVA